MNLVWVHDIRLFSIDHAPYSSGALTDSVAARYLADFDHVVLVGRPGVNADATNLTRLADPRVAIHPIARGRGALRELQAVIRDHDAVVARVPSLYGNAASRIAEKLGKPLFIEVVGDAWDSLRTHSNKGKALAPIAYLDTRRAVARGDYVIYVTERFLQGRYPSRNRTLACSDVELVVPDQAAECRLRAAQIDPWPARRLRVGSVGAIDIVYKGHADVIRALGRLRASGVDVEYRIAGGGDPARLRQAAADAGVSDLVTLSGRVPHDKITDWLAAIDLYVQPSHTEGMPRALLEAMAIGAPALASRVGGMPEVLPEDRIFKAGDVDALAKLIAATTPASAAADTRRNLERARDFESYVLQQQRSAFFHEFATHASE